MINFYPCTSITGTTEKALKGLHGADLNDQDVAIVVEAGVVKPFWLDADSGLPDNGSTIIAPTSGAGDKRWIAGSFISTVAELIDTGYDNYLTIRCGEDLSADRTVSLIMGDADRSLTIGALASVAGTNTGDQTLSGLGGVPTTRVITATSPITIGGTTSANLSADITIAIPVATALTDGYVSKTDWNTFYDKAPANAHYLTDQAESGLSAEVVVTANGKTMVTTDYAGMRASASLAPSDAHYLTDQVESGLGAEVVVTANGKTMVTTDYAGMRSSASLAPSDAHYLTDQAESGLSAEVVVTANGKSMVTTDYTGMKSLMGLGTASASATTDFAPSNAHYLTDQAESGLGAEVVVTANGKTMVTTDYAGMRSSASLAPSDAHYLTDQAESGLSAEVVVTANGKTMVTTDYAGMRTSLNVANGAHANASGGTLTTALNLGENAGLQLDAVLSGDETCSGITISGTAGTAMTYGDVCYLAPADSKWEFADADAQATAWGILGICVATAAENAATTMLIWGRVRSAAFPSFTVNGAVFLSTTAGDVTHTAPTGTTDVVRVVGFALTAEDLLFMPSNDILELT